MCILHCDAMLSYTHTNALRYQNIKNVWNVLEKPVRQLCIVWAWNMNSCMCVSLRVHWKISNMIQMYGSYSIYNKMEW